VAADTTLISSAMKDGALLGAIARADSKGFADGMHAPFALAGFSKIRRNTVVVDLGFEIGDIAGMFNEFTPGGRAAERV